MQAKWISGIAALALASVVGAAPSFAAVSTLSVQWFQVNENTPDFGSQCCSYVTNLVNSALGPNGMPVYNPSNGGPFTLTDLNSAGELQWWTPSANVLYTGTSILTSPLAQNMYVPNGTGANDASYFQTAILKGTMTVAPGGGSVTFGSDDDTFLALDGSIVAQNGGVHGTDFSTYNVAAGTYSVELFYADRDQVGANLYFSLNNASISAVPELSTWAMMLLGFGGLGFAGYRSRRSASAAA